MTSSKAHAIAFVAADSGLWYGIELVVIRDRTTLGRVRWSGFLAHGHHAREHSAVLGTVDARRRAPPACATFGQ